MQFTKHMNNAQYLIALGLVTIATGCGSGSGSVTPKLISVASPSTAQTSDISASGVNDVAMASIISLKAPVRGIYLVNSSDNKSAKIYDCAAGTNDGCLIELASGTALQDLLNASSMDVDAGTYDMVQIETCKSEGSYSAKVTASASISSTTYYSKSNGSVTTSSPAEEMTVTFTGCALQVKQPQSVTVSKGDSISFKLYFDPRELVWMGKSSGGSAWVPSGCSGTGSSAFLCMAYPNVTGTVDSANPTVERYRINGLSTFGLMFNSSGGFIGGYSRRYYSGATSGTLFNADTPIGGLTDHGDGTYELTTYGNSSDLTSSYYFKSTTFRRQNHTSSFSLLTGGTTTTGTYTATQI